MSVGLNGDTASHGAVELLDAYGVEMSSGEGGGRDGYRVRPSTNEIIIEGNTAGGFLKAVGVTPTSPPAIVPAEEAHLLGKAGGMGKTAATALLLSGGTFLASLAMGRGAQASVNSAMKTVPVVNPAKDGNFLEAGLQAAEATVIGGLATQLIRGINDAARALTGTGLPIGPSIPVAAVEQSREDRLDPIAVDNPAAAINPRMQKLAKKFAAQGHGWNSANVAKLDTVPPSMPNPEKPESPPDPPNAAPRVSDSKEMPKGDIPSTSNLHNANIDRLGDGKTATKD